MGKTEQSAIYDKRAEQALLAMVFGYGDVTLLERLDEKDFFLPEHKFLLREARLMEEAGQPIGDPVANARWFTSVSTKRRAATAKIDRLPTLIAGVVVDSLGAAHRDFYLKVVRQDRVFRSLLWMAEQIHRKALEREADPGSLLQWITDATNKLWAKAAEVDPELVEG